MEQLIDTPENWNAASKGYAEKIAPFLMESYADEFVDALEAGPDMDVLEVASGSGAITETLARRVGSVMAVDFAPQMLKILRQRMSDAGIKNMRYAKMDGQNLVLEDNSFDRAICCFGLMLFPDRHRGFSELNRVVKPGGKVVVSGWAGPDKFGSFRIFMEAISQVFPDFPKPEKTPPVFTLADPATFAEEMGAVGFRDVTVRFVTRELSVPDFETTWDMLTAGAPPVQMLFNAIGEEGKGKVKEALREITHNRFGAGPIVLSNAATLGEGWVE